MELVLKTSFAGSFEVEKTGLGLNYYDMECFRVDS
jgi:hypothetical protein